MSLKKLAKQSQMNNLLVRMKRKAGQRIKKFWWRQNISVKRHERCISFWVDGGAIGYIQPVNDDKRGMEVNFLPNGPQGGSRYHERAIFGFKGSYTFDEWAYRDFCECESQTDYSMFPVTSYSQLESKSINYMIQKILENDGKYVIKCNQAKNKNFRYKIATL